MVRGWTVNALDLLDDQGLDALSTRAVADRLGVRMNTVLRHVKTKARLLELTADAADRPALLRTLGHLTGGDPAPITPRHYWFT
ncbi:TetR family transcriptional regulator [Kitasatospora purpeofusca]|uniref:TetR family transcriptional regulator n=1 Tax=Kitasatospora purpeofusca TaxID=67352 RepID=UPI003F4AA6CB